MKACNRNVSSSSAWAVPLLLVWIVLRSALAFGGGTWTPLANLAPPDPGGIGLMLLLSDGTVLCFNNGSPDASAPGGLDAGTNCYLLTPDIHGSYVNGSWTALTPRNYPRSAFASEVVPDGRVFVAGGEYGTGINHAEIYDPPANTWTEIDPPVSLFDPSVDIFDDMISVVIADGNVLMAPVGPGPKNCGGTLIYDPETWAWSAGPTTVNGFCNQDECSWAKLPDGSILTIDSFSTSTERYIPSQNRWVADAPTPVSIWHDGEIGPAVTLPNGQAFFMGANGMNLLYTPSYSAASGAWTVATASPKINGSILETDDSPAAMLVNGNELIAMGTNCGDGSCPAPYYFYEYNQSAASGGTFTQVNGPTGNQGFGSLPSCMLDLPDGTVLFSYYNNQLYDYQPAGVPTPSGKPGILSISQNGDGSYHLTGTNLNGISEGATFGDDFQMNGNYPIVRLIDISGLVHYARTYNWSSTGIQTGTNVVTTEFTLPAAVCSTLGTNCGGNQDFQVEVVANGIASDPYPLTVPCLCPEIKNVGAWVPLANLAPPAPSGGPSSLGLMLLLSDGTVMCADNSGGNAGSTNWFLLTPDLSGSYLNGTWISLASMHYPRSGFAAEVVPDGRVFVAGGEYGTGINHAEIYDPPANTWTEIDPPVSLFDPSVDIFDDMISVVIADGNVLMAPVGPLSPGGTLIYDPTTGAWSAGPTTVNGFPNQDECSWAKLPDASILTIDPSSTNSERYLPSLNRWVADAPVPVSIWNNGEIGPAVTLANGQAFFMGANGINLLYTPSGDNTPGVWTVTEVSPDDLEIADAPGAMEVNGKFLCVLANHCVNGGCFSPPYYLYEYDSTASPAYPFTEVLENDSGTPAVAMLDLPDGNILAADFTSQLYEYQPAGSPLAAGKPVIGSIVPNPDGSYHMVGKGLNGISEGATYGDDAQMNSNYPLVRTTNGIFISYARTYDWTSTGIKMGAGSTVEFTLPAGVCVNFGTNCGGSRNLSLVAVANGIASDPYSLTVQCQCAGNIIQNGDFSLGNTNFHSDYEYVPYDYPNFTQTPQVIVGDYTVGPHVPPSYSDWAPFQTVNGSGQMLIVNGAADASEAVWDQLVTVTPNTTYQISFYLAEISTPDIVADIAVDVGANQIGGAVAPSVIDTWQQFIFPWNSGSNSVVELSLKDLQTSDFFNDFAIDDISMSALSVLETPIILTAMQSSNSFTFTWSAATNQTYQIQATSSLTPATWTDLGGPINATNTIMTTSETIGTNNQQFYRVSLLQ